MDERKRLKIPDEISSKLLFMSRHTCSICRIVNKDVQIHHIDENPRNNDDSNLIVLCLDCHSKVTGQSGFGRSYSKKELQFYKSSWEKYNSYLIPRKKTTQKDAYTINDEILFIISEIIALPEESDQVSTLFEKLYNLYLIHPNRKIVDAIIDGMWHIVLLNTVFATKSVKMIPDFLWQLYWHFFDPSEIKMSSIDEKRIIECIKILGTLGCNTCEFTKSSSILTSVFDNIDNFFQMSCMYKKTALIKSILQQYNEILAGCVKNIEESFKKSIKIIYSSAKKNSIIFDQSTLKKDEIKKLFMEILNNLKKNHSE